MNIAPIIPLMEKPATKRPRTNLEAWQVEDAARLKAIFNRRKAEAKDRKETFTQETFAELNGFTSGQMVWQLLSAHRPLNIKAAAAFAKGLGVPVSAFSPTLAAELDHMGVQPEPRLSLVPTPAERQLQWVSDQEAQLLTMFRACAQPERDTLLTVAGSLKKLMTDPAVADQAQNGAI